MKRSTLVILAIGAVPIGYEVVVTVGQWLITGRLSDVGLPYAAFISLVSACVLLIGLVKLGFERDSSTGRSTKSN